MNMKHGMLPNRPAGSTNPMAERTSTTPTPVYDVGMPGDEDEAFAKQMRASEVAYAHMPAAPIMEDEMLLAQDKKRAAINKLVMLREPLVKIITIDGSAFKIRLLTPTDSAKVIASLQTLDEEERFSKARLLALCSALMDVDGIRLEDIYSGPPEQTDPFWMRYYELSQWPALLVNRIFDAMDAFAQETDKKYAESFLK